MGLIFVMLPSFSFHLLLLLPCVPQGVQVSVGEQLRLHGANALLQGAELSADLPLQLLHLLQVLLQPLGFWVEVSMLAC